MAAFPYQKTMILYTGGTIGMMPSDKGLVASAGFERYLQDYLKDYPEIGNNQWQYQEVEPLIDSANMSPSYWQNLVGFVTDAVSCHGCDSVLILQGTDTLAYSAAALSFQLLGFDVPVLMTGAMEPAAVEGSDAKENICGSMAALSQGQVKGVQVFFHGELLSGTRCRKWRSVGRSPFVSLPALQPKPLVTRLPEELTYPFVGSLPTVNILPLFPGLTAYQLQGLMGLFLHGLVIECYGSGTGPNDDEAFIACIQQLIAQGVVVVAISQCPEGSVDFSYYEAANTFQEIGVISGGCMPREAALAKLSRLLGLGLSASEVAYYFSQNLCGEFGVGE
ncbi:asparaginase [Entomomonas sp. E2T0]|uniref:asparaginase n=1 Tax=Entomomonas sp. E2T0 TaxID=2930213 RepID=UPI0022284C1C|nr:asparaginase [Entomomonas sp. E2T0]UYZ82755.1 asparaginase [Entomomonas sp. E2T0]